MSPRGGSARSPAEWSSSIALEPSEVAAAVQLELELGHPQRALELLRANPRADAETYLEAALGLEAVGRVREASELFTQALRRDFDDDALLEAFVAHDPGACLAELERLKTEDWVEEEERERLRFCRAAALHGLGRDHEAVMQLPPVASYYVAGFGCVPAHVRGRSWELAAWAEVEPIWVWLTALSLAAYLSLRSLKKYTSVLSVEGR